MEESIYLRMFNRIQVSPDSIIKIGELAQIIAPEPILSSIQKKEIYKITEQDKSNVVIDVMKVVAAIKEGNRNVDIQIVGPAQTIIEIVYKKKEVSIPVFLLIWILLFIGSALAIMNFHEDVSMGAVHQKIYKIVTGHSVKKPLLLQIPYSIGLGFGMIMFFNHLFRKRFNEEPSPLEVEVFNYQQDLDQYVIMNENKENLKRLDDDR